MSLPGCMKPDGAEPCTAYVKIRAALSELAEAAEHDLKLNQGGDNHEDEPESSGGWWSTRCANAITTARKVLRDN